MNSIKSKNKLDLTEDQVRVYEAMTNMRLKTILVYCMLVAFFIILAYILAFANTKEDKIIFGCLDAVLAMTIGPIIKHYFPAAKAAIKRTQKIKKVA